MWYYFAWYCLFCDVYLCILACIFIHKLLHSYTHSVDMFNLKMVTGC
nr:MAG TPA: hypothetical protein [Bacteriophage sp.]